MILTRIPKNSLLCAMSLQIDVSICQVFLYYDQIPAVELSVVGLNWKDG